MRTVFLFVGALLLARVGTCLPSAQQVWVVDDTAANAPDFTDLQTAIDTVADGDVLLLKNGAYPRMEIVGKGLTIVADAGNFPLVDGSLSSSDRARVSSLGPSQMVRIQGIVFRETGPQPVLELANSTGNIWVENCQMRGVYQSPGILVSQCSSAVLLGVNAIGGATASIIKVRIV